MKLYFDPLSTQSRAVLFFLYDQDLVFEREAVSIATGAHLSDSFRRLNPSRQVPVLDDDGFVLSESGAILEYLADTRKPETLPGDPKARARVSEALDGFTTNYALYCNHYLVYVPIVPKFAVLNTLAGPIIDGIGKAEVHKMHDALETRFRDGRVYLCGDDVTIADYMGAVHIRMAAAVGIELGQWPLVQSWFSRMRTRKGWAPANAVLEGLLSARQTEKA